MTIHLSKDLEKFVQDAVATASMPARMTWSAMPCSG